MPVHGDTSFGSTALSYLSIVQIRQSWSWLNGKRRTRRVIEDDEGNTSGLKDRLRGHMGVRTSALSEGWTMGPPADSE